MDSVAAAAAAHSFSTRFPMIPSDDLIRALENIDTSTMSTRAVSDLIDWLNYYSPISRMNIHQTLASSTNHPQYQNFPHDSFMPAATYNPTQPSSFMQPLSYMPRQYNYGHILPSYSPMQQYAYFPSSPVVYQVPVEYVDETAFIIVPDHQDQTSEYEHLLELQEQIGHVNMGLSEESITKNLKTSHVAVASNLKQGEEEGEVCAVCQDAYKVNDAIGSLACGHLYHENCIKQWLLHKNVCPICKATALVF